MAANEGASFHVLSDSLLWQISCATGDNKREGRPDRSVGSTLRSNRSEVRHRFNVVR